MGTVAVLGDAGARGYRRVWGLPPEAIDFPVGSLIAQKAGIMVRRLDGTAFDERFDLHEDDRSFVAGHPEAICELLALVCSAQQVTIGGITG